MSSFDLIVRHGKLVGADGIRTADLGVKDGRIAQIASTIAESSRDEIDATGRYVLPGIIDAHVHFNEPGRAEWEGLGTGSTALAAGGGTTFFDMPLNSEPPVLNAARLFEKRALAEQKSCLDFALWGGLTPSNLDELAGLRDAGAIGLKAFMSNSGIESFSHVGTSVLREGMKRAAALGLIVAVHAEDDTLAAQHTAAIRAAGGSDAAAWLASRPVEVELAAIRTALDLAVETGCALHIVHVSSPEGIDMIDAARRIGVNVTAETCPHYLLLNEFDVARIGAPAKCAPPIRDEARRLELWSDLRAGRIDTIGSDHSPAPAELKTSPDFFAIWGGIGGCQHGFSLLLSEAATQADLLLPRLVSVFSDRVAQRFRLAHRKGRLAEGLDADLVLLSFVPPHPIAVTELKTRHPISPYIGQINRARIDQTFVRGQLAQNHPRAHFLRPQ